MSFKRFFLGALLCGVAATAVAAAPALVDAKRLSDHIRILASDEYEGRGVATPAEQKTIDYIAKQFAAEGLEPGGANGSWFQDVALSRTQNDGPVTAGFKAGGWNRNLIQSTDLVIGTEQPVDHITLKDAPLVFVGYGVNAPERGWNDYAGLDMHGKIAVVLINDPDFEADLGGAFGGKAMTYYGRWTYKYEEAVRQGAAGVLIIHETKPASYGWATVNNSWSTARFDIVRADPMKERLPVQGWMQRDVASELFKNAGFDLDTLKAAAQKKGFKAVPLNATFSADFKVKSERITSHNVIAKLTGKTRPNETVIYGAHWDHLGMGAPDANGDKIFNGAVDNASGAAALLELGRVFGAAPRTDRTVVFIAYTAEEQGLLGSEYYGANPIYPLATTVAGYNIDGLPVVGASKDMEMVGYNQSADLRADLIAAAKAQGRTVNAEAQPEAGHYYRSDHFSFAKRGVPMLYASSGEDLVRGGKAAGRAAADDYVAKRYHQPDDEWSADWDMSGAVQDMDLIYGLGRDLANSTRWPQWSADSEFKTIRDQTASARP
jgi:Zn-dependent M28 family amino/carboxypeptidase